MPRVAPRVPEPTDVLCERCGYVLNGLPDDGRCPECGTPVADSVGSTRSPTAWDRATDGPARTRGFVRTSWDVIRSPAKFYRTLAVRASLPAARRFAQLHWWVAGLLFGASAAAHALWYWSMIATMRRPAITIVGVLTYVAFTIGLAIGTYLMLAGLTRLAAGLTHWEGTYRGYRLPYAVVLRGMYYHSPHYLPVAVITAVTVIGYQLLLATGLATLDAAPKYLYVLCGEVILAAFYLFQTYWIGMRNMLYANR